MQTIYLDDNATTRPADEVVEAMVRALRDEWGNPSSIHRLGQAARRRMDLARESVCALLRCDPAELLFTSGGTEADNLAIRGVLGALPQRRLLVTSRLEHAAVRELAESMSGCGTEVVWLPADGGGLVDLEALERVLGSRAGEIALVSIMWVNNETGVIQPVEEIGRMCRERGVLFHTDATQRVGRMAVDCSSSTWDLLSFAAHKFHGPKGIGGLFVRRGVRLTPQMAGGPQERHRRGGTENVPGIAGMGVAADLARAWIDGDGPRRQALLRDGFERRLLDSTPLASINGAGSPRSWTTSNVAFRGLEAEVILLMLSERGVCASGGAACSSGSIEPSPVLGAMGVPLSRAAGSVRFSIGRDTTQQELDRGAGIVCEVVHRCFDRAAGAVRA